jgi:hypothetical protein
MIIDDVTDEFRQEAVAALNVFGLERYSQIVGDLYAAPYGGACLHIRPLGSKFGWEPCTRHLRYIRFLADVCESLRRQSCCAAQYSIAVFDDWHGYQHFASPIEPTESQRKELDGFFDSIDVHDKVLRESEGGHYKPLFGVAGSPEEKERVAAAVARILDRNPQLKEL